MIATPTFTAPISDLLTKDRIRSSRDSKLLSSRGPLWGVYRLPDAPSAFSRSIYELVSDNMGMIVREAELPFLRVEGGAFFGEHFRDVGGTSQHIWIVTSQTPLGATVRSRLYDVSPQDFTVQREWRLSSTDATAIDGDDTIIYLGVRESAPTLPGGIRGKLWKINAQAFSVLDSVNAGDFWPSSIAGDSDGCWMLGWDYGRSLTRIQQWTHDLRFVQSFTYPLSGQGHTQPAIGGGSSRIYLRTFVEEPNADWFAGGYLHTIEPSTFEILRSYGPFVSEKWLRAVGGK